MLGTSSLAVDSPGARVAFTTRRGGVSSGPYRSLNLGRLTDDDPDAVDSQPRAAAEPGSGAAGDDPPGPRGRRSTASSSGPDRTRRRSLEEVDGQATATPGVAPIGAGGRLPADRDRGRRSGRDAARRVARTGRRDHRRRACSTVRELGAAGDRSRPRSAPAPARAATRWERRSTRGSPPTARVARSAANLDLKAIARAQLERAGVDDGHRSRAVHDLPTRGLFFSHRRDRGVTGRQAGVVWLS